MASYTHQGVRRHTRRATGHAAPGPARCLDAGAAILTMATPTMARLTMARLTMAYLLWLHSLWRLDAGAAALLGSTACCLLTYAPTYVLRLLNYR